MGNKNIRIEEVGDINSHYNHLEIFTEKGTIPFMEVAITESRELCFTWYSTKQNINLNIIELEHIISVAKDFLPKALKNEDDFSEHFGD